jgi:hypothetical protein
VDFWVLEPFWGRPQPSQVGEAAISTKDKKFPEMKLMIPSQLFRPRNADSGHIYTSFFKNRSFTSFTPNKLVNDLFPIRSFSYWKGPSKEILNLPVD